LEITEAQFFELSFILRERTEQKQLTKTLKVFKTRKLTEPRGDELEAKFPTRARILNQQRAGSLQSMQGTASQPGIYFLPKSEPAMLSGLVPPPLWPPCCFFFLS
jgi:hypothetical protein